MTTDPSCLWEVHLRIPEKGPLAIACKRGGKRLTLGALHMTSPADTLRLLRELLSTFAAGDRLFVTARSHDTSLSMWTTGSKAMGLYWCASALSQLWSAQHMGRGFAHEPPLIASQARR